MRRTWLSRGCYDMEKIGLIRTATDSFLPVKLEYAFTMKENQTFLKVPLSSFVVVSMQWNKRQ